MTDYEELLPFATDIQKRYIHAISKYGSIRKAARQLGRNSRSVNRSLQSLRLAAARQGYSPEHGMTQTVPDGFHLKGTSTLYKDGKESLQWVKTNIDHERQQELMVEAVEAMAETIPREKPVKQTKGKENPNLLNLYVITDYHMGMNSWGEQTGDDWDIHIAEDLLVDWFKQAIISSPKADTAVLGQIGDFLHWDGLDAVTPTSGHVLDADTRFQKMVRITIRVMRRVITLLLKKHQNVHLIMAEGNHDLASSAWLREMFAALYENEPRITVETSPDPYYCYEFGETSLFFHHGHKKKPQTIDNVMASKFREVFGRTKHSYCHMGHLHHERSLETNLMIVEQHRTLAAADAYASSGGYMSGRSAPVITYSKDFGEVGRLTICPEMLQ